MYAFTTKHFRQYKLVYEWQMKAIVVTITVYDENYAKTKYFSS